MIQKNISYILVSKPITKLYISLYIINSNHCCRHWSFWRTYPFGALILLAHLTFWRVYPFGPLILWAHLTLWCNDHFSTINLLTHLFFCCICINKINKSILIQWIINFFFLNCLFYFIFFLYYKLKINIVQLYQA